MNVIVVTTDNKVYVKDITENWASELEELVDGWIECVYPIGLPKPFVMYVDENGHMAQKEINLVASALYGTPIHARPIVGDVVIAKERFSCAMGEYTLGSLSDREIENLISFFTNILPELDHIEAPSSSAQG